MEVGRAIGRLLADRRHARLDGRALPCVDFPISLATGMSASLLRDVALPRIAVCLRAKKNSMTTKVAEIMHSGVE